MRNCGSCGGTLVRVRRKFLQKFAYHAILLCKSCGRTEMLDRKSTRLNSSHLVISYAVFCLKKKKTTVHSTSGTSDAQPSTLARPLSRTDRPRATSPTCCFPSDCYVWHLEHSVTATTWLAPS